MADLGSCAAAYCDRPASVFMAGPTAGSSPRLTFISGDRAALLGAANDLHGVLQLRCADCAVGELEALAAIARSHSTKPTGDDHDVA